MARFIINIGITPVGYYIPSYGCYAYLYLYIHCCFF